MPNDTSNAASATPSSKRVFLSAIATSPASRQGQRCPVVQFEAGRAVAEFSVGSSGDLRLVAPGVARHHAWVAFDGRAVTLRGDDGAEPVLVAGATLRTGEVRRVTHLPSVARLGTAWLLIDDAQPPGPLIDASRLGRTASNALSDEPQRAASLFQTRELTSDELDRIALRLKQMGAADAAPILTVGPEPVAISGQRHRPAPVAAFAPDARGYDEEQPATDDDEKPPATRTRVPRSPRWRVAVLGAALAALLVVGLAQSFYPPWAANAAPPSNTPRVAASAPQPIEPQPIGKSAPGPTLSIVASPPEKALDTAETTKRESDPGESNQPSSGETLQRQAVDALARGERKLAVRLYAQLSERDPRFAPYAEARRILAATLAAR